MGFIERSKNLIKNNREHTLKLDKNKHHDFSLNNDYGNVNFSVDNNIIVAEFSGSIDTDLLSTFGERLISTTTQFNSKPWGYISDSRNVLAATPEAELLLTKIGQKMQSANCIISAFVMTSAIAISQMSRVLQSVGRDSSKCIFSDITSAKQYVSEHLKNSQAD